MTILYPVTLWLVSQLEAPRPEFPCNYQHTVTQEAPNQPANLWSQLIKWHLPPGQRETFFLVSVNRWPQDGGGRRYYSKYLGENVKMPEAFLPTRRAGRGFRATVLHMKVTSSQTLSRMLPTFYSLRIKVVFFFSRPSGWRKDATTHVLLSLLGHLQMKVILLLCHFFQPLFDLYPFFFVFLSSHLLLEAVFVRHTVPEEKKKWWALDGRKVERRRLSTRGYLHHMKNNWEKWWTVTESRGW